MTVRTITVSTSAQLTAALSTSTGGETIVLGPGQYGALALAKYSFATDVTIKGGTFSSVYLSGVKGIALDGSTVNFVPDASSTSNSQAVRIWGSDHVTISNIKLTGGPAVNGVAVSATALDSSGNVLGLPVGKGINIENSTSVTVTGSDISKFAKGIVFATSSQLTISNNAIHDLRTTPISGSVVSGLVITGNHTWNSNPWNFGGTGDHGDRIHIWTDTTPITGLVIANNVLEQGAGAPLLGIYLDDNGKGLGFKDAVITGNKLVDGQGQGVLLENVSGTVSGNTLVWSGTGTAVNNTPRFDLKDSHDIVMMDNNGPLSLRAGSRSITVARQSGLISQDDGLSSTALDSIHIDTQVTTAHDSYALAAGVRDLFYAGSGNFTGTGNSLANRIVGGTGNDVLRGNGGADVLEGRTGNDTYYVDNAAQTIVDTGGADTVYSSIAWKLQAGLENLIYTGSAGAVLEGNQGSNHIVGGAGNDTLVSNGGADTLEGGLGNDTYVIDSLGQTIIDTGGVDTVMSSVTMTLGGDIENLTLTGSANTNATGNAGSNVLTGNGAANVLDGGAGADTMSGGGGNDTYIVDNIGDKCIEVTGGIDAGGVDAVKTLLAGFTLDAGIENLIYTGTGNFAGNGNGLANAILGGIGNDVLSGYGGADQLFGGAGNDILDGGAGADTLNGGSGNDVFVFRKGEASGDTISDFFGYGAAAGDTIKLLGYGAGTTFTKAAGVNAWAITDGVTHQVEMITVVGAVHVSDVLFG